MKTTMSLIAAGAVLMAGSLAVLAQTPHAHVIQSVQEAQWGPAPPFIPAGAQLAVLSGDPTKAGPYSVRLKFPANYTIPAHSHPTDENVVVVSGSVTFGMGDKLMKTGAMNKTVSVGGYFLASAGMNHFAYTTQEATIVLYGQGPVEFTYVNAADDPRNMKRTSR